MAEATRSSTLCTTCSSDAFNGQLLSLSQPDGELEAFALIWEVYLYVGAVQQITWPPL